MIQSGHVKITLMNMLGQEVNVIYNGMLSAGKQDFSVFGKSIQKGVYIITVESKTFKSSKRLVSVKGY